MITNQEPLVQAEDMKVIVSRFEDIQEIFKMNILQHELPMDKN